MKQPKRTGSKTSPKGSDDTKCSAPPRCPIVAMGASAGGLEVFRQFFDRMPPDSGVAFVLVQHLDPTHDTLMAELLAKHTAMKVLMVEDGLKLQANRVYVIAPNVSLTIEGCTLRTGPLPQIADRKLIDQFFRSLADDQHENVIGIVLSGTGSDGTMGLKAIKEEGGLTIAQSPETAKFDSMPSQAISSGFVDHVMPVKDMPGVIVEYIKHLDLLHHRNGAEEIQQEAARYLPRIFPLLRKKTGHDFSRYKQSTLVRRIQRRMQVVYLDSVSKYVQHLRDNPEEVELLFKDLLIGVTQFFRDAESFEVLAKKIIPGMFEEKGKESQIRIWVPGCASGEEAYSFAILLAEHAENLGEVPRIQVFATDLDVEALEFARKARYPADIAKQVSPERLQRFFKKVGSNYEVIDEIRELCVFSPHNLIKDPPFSRLDLISCRNLLIYLEADLQKKLLPLFHYALNPAGHLFLGPSENVASRSELFRAVEPKHRIFQRKPTLLHSPVHVPLIDPGQVTKMQFAASAATTIPKEQSLARSIERVIIEEFAPASVIINEQAEVLYFSGNTGKYLEPPTGVPNNKIVAMARKNLRLELRAAVHRAISTGTEVVRENLALKLGREVAQINLIVRPLVELGKDPELYVVIFQELIPGTSVPRSPAENFADQEHPIIKQLESELRTTKEDLQTTIEELETSNEELKSANEELLSMNEELQSGNEELQTSKEELQSTNDELHRKIEEVDAANRSVVESEDRYRVLFSSVPVGMFVCDRQAAIQYFNRRAVELWGREPKRGVEKHCGSLKLFLPSGASLPHEKTPLLEVLRTGIGVKDVEVMIERPDGTRVPVTVNFSPLKDSFGEVTGVVTSFHDLSERKRAEEALQKSHDQFSAIINQSPVGVLLVDSRLRLQHLNPKARPTFSGIDNLIGRDLTELMGIQWPSEVANTLVGHFRHTLETGESFFSTGFTAVRQDRGVQEHYDWELHRITLPDGQTGVVCYFVEVSEHVLARQALQKSENRKSAILSAALDAIITMDHMGSIVDFNPAAENIFGRNREESIGKQLAELIIPERFRERHYNGLAHYLATGEGPVLGKRIELPALHADGREFPTELSITRIPNTEPPMFTATLRDISERKEAEEKVRRSEEELRAMANSIPQLAWIAEADGHIFWYNRGWFEYTGTTLEQMAGWGWQSVHDPKILPAVLERWTESIRTGEPFDMEFPLRGADGIFRWFLTRVNPVRNNEGRVVRWFGTNTNVDQERRTREALQEETRVLELLNKTGTAIGSELDLQSLVQTVTDAGRELSGAEFGAFFYTTKDEKGGSFLLYTLSGAPREAFEKFGHPRATPVFAPTFKGEGPVRSGDITKDPRYGKMAPHHGMPKGHLPVRSYLAVPVISRSGESIGGLFYGHPEPDVFTERAERLLVGIAAQAAIAIDNAQLYEAAQKEIAERKAAEAELANKIRLTTMRAEISEALATSDKLEAVLQRCSESLVRHLDAAFARIWTLDQGEDILKLQASAGLYTHLDGPHSQIKVGEFKIGRIAQNCQPHLSNDVPHDPNISSPEWARKEGMVAFAGYPLRVEQKVIGVIAMFARHLLTEEVLKELSLIADGLAQWIERKHAQSALQKAKEELEQRVSERTASLQETTEQLEAFCYTIAHDLRSPLRAQQSFAQVLLEDYKNVMDDAGCEYAQRIINSAKRLDQLVNDLLAYSRLSRTELKFEKVELDKVVSDIQSQLAVEIENQNATISVGPLLPVFAYEPTMNLVITNLITNALKFMKPGVPPRLHIFSEAKEDFVRLWVEDNGIGVGPENREKIFGVFERLHGMEKYPGTGIGLAIVQKGVERMGGRVGIESEPGKGSRFWIELPKG